MKSRSQVSLNDPNDAFVIFRDELTPSVTDVRGESVEIDLGDYAHLWAHAEMSSRIRWIAETLHNPEGRGLGIRFWTSFVPDRSQYVERMRKGKLLWKPND